MLKNREIRVPVAPGEKSVFRHLNGFAGKKFFLLSWFTLSLTALGETPPHIANGTHSRVLTDAENARLEAGLFPCDLSQSEALLSLFPENHSCKECHQSKRASLQRAEKKAGIHLLESNSYGSIPGYVAGTENNFANSFHQAYVILHLHSHQKAGADVRSVLDSYLTGFLLHMAEIKLIQNTQKKFGKLKDSSINSVVDNIRKAIAPLEGDYRARAVKGMAIAKQELEKAYRGKSEKERISEGQKYFLDLCQALESAYEEKGFRKENGILEMTPEEKAEIFGSRQRVTDLYISTEALPMGAFSSWRNRHTEPNLARLLCDFAGKGLPLHFPTGIAHVPPLYKALRKRARNSGLDPGKFIKFEEGHWLHSPERDERDKVEVMRAIQRLDQEKLRADETQRKVIEAKIIQLESQLPDHSR